MNPDTLDAKKIKAIALVVVAVIVVVALIAWLISYESTGKLIISTGSPTASITITKTGVTSQPSGLPKTGTGNLSLTLGTGSYFITVQGNALASSQLVQVTAHSTQTFTIKPPQISGVEPVIIGSVSDFAVDKTGVSYLNPNDSKISVLSAGNGHTELPSPTTFLTASWADPNFGVAEAVNGDLYLISQHQVTPLKTPASGQPAELEDFTVAADHTIYVAVGDSVYRGQAGGTFSKIFSNREEGAKLVAGGGGVVALTSGGESGENSSNTKAPNPGAGLVVIQNGGTVITKKIDPVSAAWSPDGQYLAVSTQTSSEVFDSSLNQVASIPQQSFQAPVWLDDNILYYKVQDQLWSFNRTGQKSQIIANMPQGDIIEQIGLSSDKSYIYASTDDQDNNQALVRVGLRSQPVAKMVYDLQDILPQKNDDPGYALGLYNFSGAPSIVLTPYPGTDAGGELQSVKVQLQGQGFNLSALQFVVNPPATSQ